MRKSTDRILTTHVGSLPRPGGLVELMFARAEGEAVDAALLERKTGEAVIEVVRHQREAGIDIVSDGEMSKPSYATYVTERLTGFGGTSNLPKLSDILDYPNVASAYFNDPGVLSLNKNRPACDGPVASKGIGDAEKDISHFRNALDLAPPEDAFMTAASPGLVSMFLGNTYYDTEEEFLYAVADAMMPEYRAIVDAGYMLQFDCPDLAMTRHREFAEAPVEDFRAYARLHIEVLNSILDRFPRDRLRVHICWGNYPGPHHRDVPMAQIVDLLLTLRTGALLFEGANSRHAHEWKVWETVDLPDDMVIVPGVIESMSNRIEHPELIAERLVRYARLVGRENVIAGSDCGFGTFVGLDLVDPAIAWRKLAALAEGARIASEELW
ncbi:MAG: cobalamin-independent methionine synthase II family protein [Rhodospirillaceae bacterium]|nr:cobalamin-independent methionine synthase II family protein [Rhodospirillaceae bacterium]MYH36801.1 cobalamin-independent methionine synthase II family protein [Rhodospirillaceae bacterium]MYK15828.1 cobalamin-independent methionine synthase II family protein [Rhodospirillaceae bacterium]